MTTIEVYDVAANYQGMQAGWFGDLVKEKFGLELKDVYKRQGLPDWRLCYSTWLFWNRQFREEAL